MSIFKKMLTAIKGGANELGEAIVDTQAIRILEQEVRDADQSLRQAKDELVSIIAKRKIAEEEVTAVRNRISQYEGHLGPILGKEDGGGSLTAQEAELKMELATRISELEAEASDKDSQLQGWQAAETKTSSSISSTEQRITKLKQRLESVKATESVHKAMSQVAAANSGSTSSLNTAMDSLQSIERKQREQEKKFEAAEEIERKTKGVDLDEKLKAAGLLNPGSNANSVIERIRAQKKG